MTKTGKIFNAFASGIKPEQKLSITEWCYENVKLERSTGQVQADFSKTPYLIRPFESCINDDLKAVILQAPTGSGKTSLMECFTIYTILERPNPLLLIAQTDADINDWATTGLMPAIQASEKVRALLPKDRHAMTKGLLSFPHMPIYITGANMSGLQSKSCTTVWGDECVFWKKGMMAHANKRTHDRTFSKCVYTSQPYLKGDDFNLAFRQTYKHEFQYLCPSCNERHPWRFENLKWEDVPLAEIDPVYHCPCGHTFSDDPLTRRAMTESGDYVPMENHNPVAGHVGFTFNALAVWWIPFKTLAVEFIQANKEAKKGNLEPLQTFRNKRLAQEWDTEEELETPEPISIGDYLLGDAEPYSHTFMTVDVQSYDATGIYFYYVIRTWSQDGKSRLLDYGTLPSFTDILVKQNAFGILPHNLALDNAYKTDEVNEFAATHGFVCLNGGKESYYNITDRNTGKTYKRIFSNRKNERTTTGKVSKSYMFASQRLKGILSTLKQSPAWEIPQDVSDQYLQHLGAYRYRTSKGQGTWDAGSRRKDLADCEIMQIVLAIINKIFGTPDDTDKE